MDHISLRPTTLRGGLAVLAAHFPRSHYAIEAIIDNFAGEPRLLFRAYVDKPAPTHGPFAPSIAAAVAGLIAQDRPTAPANLDVNDQGAEVLS